MNWGWGDKQGLGGRTGAWGCEPGLGGAESGLERGGRTGLEEENRARGDEPGWGGTGPGLGGAALGLGGRTGVWGRNLDLTVA